MQDGYGIKKIKERKSFRTDEYFEYEDHLLAIEYIHVNEEGYIQ